MTRAAGTVTWPVRTSTPVRVAVSGLFGVLLSAGTATAHVGGLSGTIEDPSVPTWLTIATGGVIIGASFLLTSFLTDHAAIRAVNAWNLRVPAPASVRTAAKRAVGAAGVAVLALVVWTGLFEPPSPTANFAILVVWVGWWAGYTMTVYLLGNTWPWVNPWRTIAGVLPRIRRRAYPERWGAWPSVVGLLALVWVEVISPVAEDPRLLAGLILGYTAVTLLGASVYGTETWFGAVDPVARVFQTYGRVAPFQRTADGVAFTLPGTAVAEEARPGTPGETAFVVALLWATTYDGVVSTPAWAAGIRAVVGAGVPALLVYLAAMVAGFGLFLAAYRLAARKAREVTGSYVSAGFVERWFAPSLLPIAAGYHVAHFLGYFVSLLPALAAVAVSPFAPPADPQVIVVPGWFGTLQLLSVLVGHLFAIWIAHSISFELFPGVLRPIRSQYPFIAVMVFYTMTSMWVVIQPFSAPPYV